MIHHNHRVARGGYPLCSAETSETDSLHAFVQDCIEPGSTVHTDGWLGYSGLQKKGYDHEITRLRGNLRDARKSLPRVHQVVSPLKRWLLGTHQGAISHQHLVYCLDEFTFRFNRRNSKSRGKLLFRFVEQALATASEPYQAIAQRTKASQTATQSVMAS